MGRSGYAAFVDRQASERFQKPAITPAGDCEDVFSNDAPGFSRKDSFVRPRAKDNGIDCNRLSVTAAEKEGEDDDESLEGLFDNDELGSETQKDPDELSGMFGNAELFPPNEKKHGGKDGAKPDSGPAADINKCVESIKDGVEDLAEGLTDLIKDLGD